MTKARASGAEPLRHLRTPPSVAPRWPPPGTVNEAFGTWAAFRECCAHLHHRERAAQTVAATLHLRADSDDEADNDDDDEIVVHGASSIVECLAARWQRAQRHLGEQAEREFVLWALMTGHAALRQADDPLENTHASNLEWVAWQLMNSRREIALLFFDDPIAARRTAVGQLTLFELSSCARRRRTRSRNR